MELDAFDLFGKSHRLYVEGVRRAIRERLEAHYEDKWWEEGVLAALWGPVKEQMEAEVAKNDSAEKHVLLDSRHFGYIIRKHHQTAFLQSFPDSVRAFTRFRQLTTVRNDWAHVQDISLGRYRQAADIMQDILAALNRQEALEIERMSKDAMANSTAEITQEPIEEADLESSPVISTTPLGEPVDSWGRLQSYLQLERSVSIDSDDRERRIARISVNVTNTAPESPDLPRVVFREIVLHSGHNGTQQIGQLEPGATAEVNFQVPETRLLSFELSLSAEIDGQELLRFQRRAELPTEATASIKKRFITDFEDIGVKGFVTEAVETVGKADESLRMTEVAQLRESAREFAARANGAMGDLDSVFRAYGMQREDILGARMRELHVTLTNFKSKVEEFDQAVGETDIEKMREVQASLKDAQLAVLRVESELRSVSGG